jgi:hypothetical protein
MRKKILFGLVRYTEYALNSPGDICNLMGCYWQACKASNFIGQQLGGCMFSFGSSLQDGLQFSQDPWLKHKAGCNETRINVRISIFRLS